MSDLISRKEIIDRLERVIQNGVPSEDGMHPISAETVLEVVKELSELGTNLAEVGTDAISRHVAIDALERAKQNIHHNIERAIGDAICEILDEVENGIKQLPPIQPEITHEQAVAYLQSTGWMQEHDRQMMLDGVHRLTAQPEPHWIPVTEEPKKEEKSYWVCLEDGGQCQCRWTNDVYGIGANPWSKWGWKKVDLPQFSKVVAYMPLPEPYRGVTE